MLKFSNTEPSVSWQTAIASYGSLPPLHQQHTHLSASQCCSHCWHSFKVHQEEPQWLITTGVQISSHRKQCYLPWRSWNGLRVYKTPLLIILDCPWLRTRHADICWCRVQRGKVQTELCVCNLKCPHPATSSSPFRQGSAHVTISTKLSFPPPTKKGFVYDVRRALYYSNALCCLGNTFMYVPWKIFWRHLKSLQEEMKMQNADPISWEGQAASGGEPGHLQALPNHQNAYCGAPVLKSLQFAQSLQKESSRTVLNLEGNGNEYAGYFGSCTSR